MTPEADGHHKKLRDPLPKNKAPTFSSLYEVQKKESEKSAAIKADRNILQRIITAYDAGRSVDLPRILSHDLMAVPLAIADTNGQLRTGNAEFLVVSSQDTDVFLLLVSHFDKMSCKQLWMKAGTSKKPNSHDSLECEEKNS
ncbi:hypothetical protein ACROYT_G033445 [Oculina patagonica]